MHPRRFARVRPTGRNSDLAKLIVGPKDPVVDCRVVDYSPGAHALRCRVRPSCPIDFNCYLAVPRSIAVLFGTPGDVSGSCFNGLVFHDVSRSPRGRGADRGDAFALVAVVAETEFHLRRRRISKPAQPRFYRRSYFGDF